MGMIVRKNVKITKGLHVNVTPNGWTLTVGKRDRCVNYNPKTGTAIANVGVYGTGARWRGKVAEEHKWTAILAAFLAAFF